MDGDKRANDNKHDRGDNALIYEDTEHVHIGEHAPSMPR